MIRKAFIVSLILLATHAVLVNIKPNPKSQYPFQENAVKAQSFIYEEDKENIIIGSSLSNRMIMNELPGIYNLSFTGLGIFDGLQIISYHEIVPKNIFIEINIIQREENANFLSHINSPVLAPVKRHFPSLREGYQPIGMFAENLMEEVKGAKKNSIDTPNDETFNRILNQEKGHYSEIPDEQFLTNQFIKLKKEIDKLEQKGSSIIFFEMPVNEQLCDLPRPRVIRKFFNEYFPPSKYKYIEMPDCRDYTTTDGVHLSEDEALRYTTYFKSKINEIVSYARKISLY
jgi:hypothetical protein